MKYSHCTMNDLQQALEETNKKYEGNITFNRLDSQNFTLKVKDSKGPGHRLGFPQIDPFVYAKEGKVATIAKAPRDRLGRRRMINACYHVHGDFFDALFSIAPDAVIYSRGNRITKDYGNWEDWNIGSQLVPYYASEACECT